MSRVDLLKKITYVLGKIFLPSITFQIKQMVTETSVIFNNLT
jgi:hypothetical protein